MKFRKKPVVIEAIQYSDDFRVVNEIGKWTSFRMNNGELFIPTLEGEMRAQFGDWIIKGVAGECYACKPDIFEATYERVEESE